jgi:biofilm protein TabA
MLTGSLIQRSRYLDLLRGDFWQQAFDALAALGPDSPLGITPLCGQHMAINVHTYETKPEVSCAWESHANTIDLQYMIAGSEWIGYSPVELLGEPIGYRPDRERFDYAPYSARTKVYLGAGQWAVFFPEDAHQPKIATVEPAAVLKAVVKIDCSLLMAGPR